MYTPLAQREYSEWWPEHIKAYHHAAKESYANYLATCKLYAEYRGSATGTTNQYLARVCLTMESHWRQLENVYRPAVEEWERQCDNQAARDDVWVARHE